MIRELLCNVRLEFLKQIKLNSKCLFWKIALKWSLTSMCQLSCDMACTCSFAVFFFLKENLRNMLINRTTLYYLWYILQNCKKKKYYIHFVTSYKQYLAQVLVCRCNSAIQVYMNFWEITVQNWEINYPIYEWRNFFSYS